MFKFCFQRWRVIQIFVKNARLHFYQINMVFYSIFNDLFQDDSYLDLIEAWHSSRSIVLFRVVAIVVMPHLILISPNESRFNPVFVLKYRQIWQSEKLENVSNNE